MFRVNAKKRKLPENGIAEAWYVDVIFMFRCDVSIKPGEHTIKKLFREVQQWDIPCCFLQSPALES